MCDGCDLVVYIYCVGLGLFVFCGDWFCNVCFIEYWGFSIDDDDEVNNEVEENDSIFLFIFVIVNV